MAKMTISASTAAAATTAQIFAKEAYHEAKENSFWFKMAAKSDNAVIHQRDELTKDKGDRVLVVLFPNIDISSTANHGVGAENTLEGNEVSVTPQGDSVVINQLRQAMRIDGKLSEQRASYDLRLEIKDKLQHWGSRIFDKIWFYTLSGIQFQDQGSNNVFDTAAANSSIMYGGGKTALADLTSSDTFTLDLISDAKVCAQVGVIGGTTIYKIRPVQAEGQFHYCAVLHPYQISSVKNTDDWKNAMLQAAQRSTETNPIFTGMVGMRDNVILKQHDLVYTASDAGADSNVDYATALFFGAQAGIFAEASQGFDWVEQKFDYGQEWGIATGFIAGFRKARFNSLDFGVMALKTAARNPKL